MTFVPPQFRGPVCPRATQGNCDEETARCGTDRRVISFVRGKRSGSCRKCCPGRGVGRGGAGTGRRGGGRVHRIHGGACDRAFLGSRAVRIALPARRERKPCGPGAQQQAAARASSPPPVKTPETPCRKRPRRRFRDLNRGVGGEDRRPLSKKFDTSGKSPAYLHHRKNFRARAGKPAAGFLIWILSNWTAISFHGVRHQAGTFARPVGADGLHVSLLAQFMAMSIEKTR